jgi:hypothetical protein
MVPVESLRELLAGVPAAEDGQERQFTPAEAAEWLHRNLGGRKRTPAAVRKVMRTGFRGVVLKSYFYGRERRTTEADLRQFVVRTGAILRPPAPETAETPLTLVAAAPTKREVATKTNDDPGDEIAAAHERFELRRTPASARPPGQRRASGGA